MYKNFNLTESEKEQILNMHKDHGYGQPLSESFDDYKMSAPRSKSISKISSKLNSTPAGFGKGKPWTDNPKYQTDREKLIQNKDKERDSDKSSVYVGQGSYLEKDTKQREKDYEEYEKLRIKKQQSRVLSLFSLIGEVNGKIKIKDLIEKGELDSNTVNSIIDEIDKNKSLVVGFYSSYEKDRAQEKIDSYIRKGILDSDIVKYITSKLPNS
jgi:hypothetical protein